MGEIPNDGSAKTVKFETKVVTSIQIVTIDGNGKDLGFSEIEVYPARTGCYGLCGLGGSLDRIDAGPVYILYHGFPAFRDDIGRSAYQK